ncbi:LacI family DNA-binding transcriptional regulator [Cellulomonas sp. Leaf395]|uniref:LacI family DNA-binding transcriptional regulator n=1 Tax=Cellulomonas sp. Leaf395 TaxID=1736362 RepID=UPI0009EA3A67|nr:LacI family DNA-binding transcriptional regulator [Cellulomonas sp. Leaf395]
MKALPTPPEGETGPVTIYDVAARAGVGIATVSRAMNGSAPVAEATRAKVLAAVEELGFRPSHAGTSLAARTHAANGIVFPDLSGPYYAEVLLGYEETASRLGRSVLVLATHGRPDPDAAVRDLAGRVDGIVLLGRTVPDHVVEALSAFGLPVVVVARPEVAGVDSVRANSVDAARALGEHLAGHDLRKVAFLGSPEESPDVAERWRGVREGLGAHGIEPTVTPCLFDEESGARVAAGLLAVDDRPDALVCANDEIALGAIVAAEQIGLRVGRDIAITGWDDVMAARHARPALTTVRQPMRALGTLAAEVLDQRINATRTTPRHELLATDLVVRDSCGPHP